MLICQRLFVRLIDSLLPICIHDKPQPNEQAARSRPEVRHHPQPQQPDVREVRSRHKKSHSRHAVASATDEVDCRRRNARRAGRKLDIRSFVLTSTEQVCRAREVHRQSERLAIRANSDMEDTGKVSPASTASVSTPDVS